jgi:hypothetical protein
MINIFSRFKEKNEKLNGEVISGPLDWFKSFISYLGSHQYILMVLCIFGVALFLRLWRIDSVPGGYGPQEQGAVEQIMAMGKNKLWLGGEFYRAAYLYPAFIITKIFGLAIYLYLNGFPRKLLSLLHFYFLSRRFILLFQD